MGFLNFILGLHSLVRWLVVIVAVALIVKLIIGLVQKSKFDRMSAGLTAAFSGLMDLQALLGLVYFAWSGIAMNALFAMGTPVIRTRWEHLFVMIIAVVVAHLPARWKEKTDTVRTRNTLIAVVGALLLVVLGVGLLMGARWLPRWPF